MAMAPKPAKRTNSTGKKLQAIRERLGLNIAQAARAIHVTTATWSQWEGGKRQPSDAHWLLISLLENGTIK